MKSLSDIGEKNLISSIVKPILEVQEEYVEVGPGDDATVLNFPTGSSLVATIDKIQSG